MLGNRTWWGGDGDWGALGTFSGAGGVCRIVDRVLIVVWTVKRVLVVVWVVKRVLVAR